MQILRVALPVVSAVQVAQEMQTRWHLRGFAQLDLVVVVAAVLLPQVAVQAVQAASRLLVAVQVEHVDPLQGRQAQVAQERLAWL